MASIQFKNFKIDIEVQNIDGAFNEIFDMAFPKGYWVLLTIENGSGEKESFPRTDSNRTIKTYTTYEEAIDDVANLLKEYFKQ